MDALVAALFRFFRFRFSPRRLAVGTAAAILRRESSGSDVSESINCISLFSQPAIADLLCVTK